MHDKRRVRPSVLSSHVERPTFASHRQRFGLGLLLTGLIVLNLILARTSVYPRISADPGDWEVTDPRRFISHQKAPKTQRTFSPLRPEGYASLSVDYRRWSDVFPAELDSMLPQAGHDIPVSRLRSTAHKRRGRKLHQASQGNPDIDLSHTGQEVPDSELSPTEQGFADDNDPGETGYSDSTECEKAEPSDDMWTMCAKKGYAQRKCKRCGRDEFWAGDWCKEEGSSLNCRPCPGFTGNNFTYHTKRRCTYPNKYECILEQHQCEAGCDVTGETYTCVCPEGRLLNDDGRSCYDALTFDLRLELVSLDTTDPTSPQDSRDMRQGIERHLAQKLPRVSEVTTKILKYRDGNVAADVHIAMNKTGSQTAANNMTNALVSLSKKQANIVGREFIVYIRLNGLEVTSETDKCQVLTALEPCPRGHKCSTNRVGAVCRPTSMGFKGMDEVGGSYMALGVSIIACTAVILAFALRLVTANINETMGLLEDYTEQDFWNEVHGRSPT